MTEPVITYPPEMLPKPDEDDIIEVWVEDEQSGDQQPSRRLVYSSEWVGGQPKL